MISGHNETVNPTKTAFVCVARKILACCDRVKTWPPIAVLLGVLSFCVGIISVVADYDQLFGGEESTKPPFIGFDQVGKANSFSSHLQENGPLGSTEALQAAAYPNGAGKIVIVAPFENLSSSRGLSEAPRSILENIIFELGGTPVERTRLDAILKEQQFGHFSGLVDRRTAISLGKMLNARYIITGTIEKVSSETKNFSGYGIKTTQKIISTSIRIRMMDLETGEIVFSRSLQGEIPYLSSTYGSEASDNPAYEVIKEALKALYDDQKLMTFFSSRRKAD
jgi:TolB-like protein